MNNKIYGRLEVIIEIDRGRKKISRVETNYSSGIGEAKFRWVDLINHWVGFHWVC